MIGRRGFITGLVSLVAAPAIVRAGSLMSVKVMPSLSALEIINLAAERLINPPIMFTEGWVINLADYPYCTNSADTLKWLTENRPRLIADSEFTHVERCG